MVIFFPNVKKIAETHSDVDVKFSQTQLSPLSRVLLQASAVVRQSRLTCKATDKARLAWLHYSESSCKVLAYEVWMGLSLGGAHTIAVGVYNNRSTFGVENFLYALSDLHG